MVVKEYPRLVQFFSYAVKSRLAAYKTPKNGKPRAKHHRLKRSLDLVMRPQIRKTQLGTFANLDCVEALPAPVRQPLYPLFSQNAREATGSNQATGVVSMNFQKRVELSLRMVLSVTEHAERMIDQSGNHLFGFTAMAYSAVCVRANINGPPYTSRESCTTKSKRNE